MSENSQFEVRIPPCRSLGDINFDYDSLLISCHENDFSAANIKHCLNEWQNITSDKVILDLVKGYKIEFEEIPHQTTVPRECKFNLTELEYVRNEIQILLAKKVIQISTFEPGQFISSIFLRPKKNGKFRMILNLKYLNEYVYYAHFKMDTLQSCLNLVTPSCFMASIDLTDAYYSVPIHPEHQKYLKFTFDGMLYKFTAMPNGLVSAPRNFTLLLKPVLASLRQKGHISSAYLDDIFLVGDSLSQCNNNVKDTLLLLKKLGFFINTDKSVTQPTNCIEHLGFLLNSQDMSVSLAKDKANNLTALATRMYNGNTHTIREVAKLIGTLISCFPAVNYGQLYYRPLEIDKSLALKLNAGNFESYMSLTKQSKLCLKWWISQAHICRQPISHGNPSIILQTDASNSGWGAFRLGHEPTGGRWDKEDLDQHNNYLELRAALFGLQSLCKQVQNSHILLQLDNTTAVSYIRNMGGTNSLLCNQVASQIWHWSIERNIWLSATHIAGVENVVADKASRKFNDRTEWQLDPKIFKFVTDKLGVPSIDMF